MKAETENSTVHSLALNQLTIEQHSLRAEQIRRECEYFAKRKAYIPDD